ncbi:MAG: response regulator, partial [bacterium]|nr:response regulator [bacterium]
QKGEILLAARIRENDTREPRDPREAGRETTIQLHFAISDTGIGVSMEKRETIFEAFVQADNSTTRKYGGSGLGLSISARLVSLMNGKIWVESPSNVEYNENTVFHAASQEGGPGSTFHFSVSTKTSERKREQASITGMQRLKGVPVLLLDENPTSRKILEEQLFLWGLKAKTVKSEEQTLSALKREPFSVVILDTKLIGLDGFKLAEKIKMHQEYGDIKIIMLVTSGQIGDARRSYELGIAGYLTKPIEPFELLDAIRRVIGLSALSEDKQELVTKHSIRQDIETFRFLVAEDNKINQKLIRMRLLKLGHQAAVVNNGKELLDKWKTGTFDLILTDIQMPEMDGLEVTRMIREVEAELMKNGNSREFHHIPIVALTAHAMKGDREKFLDAGMDAYIAKPIDVPDLISTIKRVTPLIRKNKKSNIPVSQLST